MSDCARCIELSALLVQAEDANAELGRQLAGVESNMRRVGAENVALRAERTRMSEDDPGSEDAKRLLALWRDLYRDGNTRVNIDLTEIRGRRVKWAIKKFGVERTENAIRGIANDDWMMGRHPQTRGSKPLPNDLKLAFKDVEWFDRCEAAYENRGAARPAMEGPTGVEALLPKLEQVKEIRPGQWNARCPAHEDRHASLSVGQGDKGAVVHCHAGCTVDDIAQAAGVLVGSLFDPDDPAPRSTPSIVHQEPEMLPTEQQIMAWQHRLQNHTALLDRLAAVRGWTPLTMQTLGIGWDDTEKRLTFPVTSESGELVNVLRYLPGGKPKMLGLKHRARDLFPRPEQIDGADVWLVEGEPDAISGVELDLPAVAVPGANGWRDQWAPRFAGRRVVVCMDCDDPGRKLAERVARSLVAVAREVRVVDLDPERSDGFDISDLLRDRPASFDQADHARLASQMLRKLAADSTAVVRLGEAA